MLKRQKPTTAPARFESKSMNSMLKCIMERAQQEESGSGILDTVKKGVDFLLNPIGTLTKKATEVAPKVARRQAEPFFRERRTTPLETTTPGQGGGGFDTSDEMPSRGFGGPPGGKFEKLGTGALYTTGLPFAMLRAGAAAQQADYEAYRRVGPIGQMALGGLLSATNSAFLAPFMSGGTTPVAGSDQITQDDMNIDPTIEGEAENVSREAAEQDERTDDEPEDPRTGDPRQDQPEEDDTTTGATTTTGASTSTRSRPFVSYAKKITKSDRSTMQA